MLGWVNLCFVLVRLRTPGSDICVGFHLSDVFGTDMSAGHSSSLLPLAVGWNMFSVQRGLRLGGETIQAGRVVRCPCLETLSCGQSTGTKVDTVQIYLGVDSVVVLTKTMGIFVDLSLVSMLQMRVVVGRA